MPIEVAIKALAVWVAILLLAVVNGALREAILVPRLGPAPGLVLSGVLLSCLILIAAYLFLPWLGTRSTSQRVLIGLGWLIHTETGLPACQWQHLATGSGSDGDGALARSQAQRLALIELA